MLKDKHSSALCITLCLILASTWTSSKALSFTDDAPDTSILTSGKSGTALVDKLIENLGSFGAYRYDGTQEARNGKKSLNASGTFYFKPTQSMRIEVKEFGSKSGSILVKNSDGKIKAKGGAPMLGIKMSLAPDSRLLQMPNGLSAFDCNLLALFDRLKKESASGCKILAAEQPIQTENFAKPAIVIESQMPGESGVKVVDRVFVDPALKVPLQWDQFANGQFQSRSKFQNYKTNMNLDDSLFIM